MIGFVQHRLLYHIRVVGQRDLVWRDVSFDLDDAPQLWGRLLGLLRLSFFGIRRHRYQEWHRLADLALPQ